MITKSGLGSAGRMAAVVAVLAGAALTAYGQGGVGPDVIVGDIPDWSKYTTTAIGGKHAYSIGTTSCNLGTERLTWIADNPVHPVISQNMYRLMNGRFEQIGQAWLKHGFCALQGDVCSSNCSPNPSGCPALGVLCSDPYGSGLNGSQSGLGPKAEVNAATGVFPYPWINNGTGSGQLFKRLVVNESELNNAGARYFVSSMYVHPEDAQAGNDNNNESYRRITFGANLDMALQDTTQRMKPGIQAWRDHGLGVNIPDPGVTLSNVDVPGDGRFIVGVKVTNIGGGNWHYEYAIQNLTSDRSGASFNLVMPPTGVATNIGFRDVDYHSGEPFSGTDWEVVQSGGALTWRVTETHGQNANANALRWDTIYNFWFDANVPPSGGAATIGLFKPGAIGNIGAATIVPSPDGVFRPLNDLCNGPQAVGPGLTNFSNQNANTDGPTMGGCATGGNMQIGSDVWFLYTSGATAGQTTISLCGSAFDTKMAVYPVGACPTAGSEIACSDNAGTCASDANGAEIILNVAANTGYLIRVGGVNGASGDGVMNITAPTPPGGAPSNNACANAIFIADGQTLTGTTTGATNDGTATCGNSNTTPDVWYKYIPTRSERVNFDTCGSPLNTVLAVYRDSCGGVQVGCNDNALAGPCSGTSQSYAAINAIAGTTYLVRVAGSNGGTGSFNLRVTGGGGATPAANDTCTGRAVAVAGTTAFNTSLAQTDGPAVTGCGSVTQIENDLWYNFLATSTSRMSFAVTDTSYAGKIAVYNGAGCVNFGTRLLGCASGPASVTLDVLAGQNYTVRVGGGQGTGNLRIGAPATCVADMDDGTGTGTPDGGVTIDDLLYYLGIYADGAARADVDDGSGTGTPDGGVTIDDLLYYLTRYEAGC